MAARGLSFPEWLTHWPSQPPQPKAQLAGFLGIQIQKLSLFVSIFNQGQSSCGHLSIWIYWLRQGSGHRRAAGIAAMRSTKPSLQHQQHVLLLLDTVHYGQCTAVQCTFNHNFLQMDPFSNLPPYCPVSSTSHQGAHTWGISCLLSALQPSKARLLYRFFFLKKKVSSF